MGDLFGRLVDRCANDSRAAPRREFFWPNFAAVVRWAVREKAKVQQCTCHYCPSTAKELQIPAPTTLEPRPQHFCHIFCCRGEAGVAFNNVGAIIFPSWGICGAWNSQRWTLNTSDLKRRLADTMDKHITIRHRRSCWSKL